MEVQPPRFAQREHYRLRDPQPKNSALGLIEGQDTPN